MDYRWITAILLILISEIYCAPQSYHKVSHQKHEEKTEEVYSSDPSHHRVPSSLTQSTHASNLGSYDSHSTGNSMYDQRQRIYDSNFNSQYDNFNKKIQPPDNLAYSSYYVSHSPSSSSHVIKGDLPFVNNYQTSNQYGIKSFQENEMSYGRNNFAGTVLNERSDVIENGNYDNGQKLLKLTAVPGLATSSSAVRGDMLTLHTGETFDNSELSSGTNLKSFQTTQHLPTSQYAEQTKSQLNTHETVISKTSSNHQSQPKITSSYFVKPQLDHSSILESNLNSESKKSGYVFSTKEDSSHLSQPKITSSYFMEPQIDHSSIVESNFNSGSKTTGYVFSTKEDSSHLSQPKITSSYFIKPQVDQTSILETNLNTGSKTSGYVFTTKEDSSHLSQPKITSSYFVKPEIDHSRILESNLNSGGKKSGYVVSTKEETYSNSNGDGWTKKVHEYQPLLNGQESGPLKKYSTFKTTGSQTALENNKNSDVFVAPGFIGKESQQLLSEETQPNYNIGHQISLSQLEHTYNHRIEPSQSSWSSWSSWSAWSSGPQEYSIESRRRIDSASMTKQEPISDLSKTETKNIYKSSTYQQNEKQVKNVEGAVTNSNRNPIILGTINQPVNTKDSSAYTWLVSSSNTPQQIHPAIANKQIESASLTRDDAFIQSQKEILPVINNNNKFVSQMQQNFNHDTNVKIPGDVQTTILQPNVKSVKKSKTEHQEFVQLSYDSQKPKSETFLTDDFPRRGVNEESSLQHQETIVAPFPDQQETNIQNSNVKIEYQKQIKPAINIVSVKSQPISDLEFNKGQNVNVQQSQTLTINTNNHEKESEDIIPGSISNTFIDQERGSISDILETKNGNHGFSENEPVDNTKITHTGKKFSSSFKKEVHNSTEIIESHSDDYNNESKKLRTATHQIVNGAENPQTHNYKFHEQEYMQSQFGPQRNLERIEQINPVYDATSNTRSYNQQFTNSFNKYQSNYGVADESLLEKMKQNEGKLELHGKATEKFNVQNQEMEMKQNLEQMKNHMMIELRKKHGFQTPVTFEASQSYGPQIRTGKNKMQSEHYIEKHISQTHMEPQSVLHFQTQSTSLNQESEPCPFGQEGPELEKSFDIHQTHDSGIKSFEKQRLLDSDDLFRRMRQKRYIPSFSFFHNENKHNINEHRRFEDQAEDFLGKEINAQIEENQRPDSSFNLQQESQQLLQNPDFQFNSNNQHDFKNFGQQHENLQQESQQVQESPDFQFSSNTDQDFKDFGQKHKNLQQESQQIQESPDFQFSSNTHQDFKDFGQQHENLQQESQQIQESPDFQFSSNTHQDFKDFGQQHENLQQESQQIQQNSDFQFKSNNIHDFKDFGQQTENKEIEEGNQKEEQSQEFKQDGRSFTKTSPKVEYTEAEYKELLQQLHEFVSTMNSRNKTLNDLLNEFENIHSGNQKQENNLSNQEKNKSGLDNLNQETFQATPNVNQQMEETQSPLTQEQQPEENSRQQSQRNESPEKLSDLGQQTENDFSQQSNSNVPFFHDTQEIQSPQQVFDLGKQQQTEDFGQLTETEVEGGQQTQEQEKPQKLIELGQQTQDDFSQLNSDNLFQQTDANIEFGKQNTVNHSTQNQILEQVQDFSQQNNDDFQFSQAKQETQTAKIYNLGYDQIPQEEIAGDFGQQNEFPQKVTELGQQTQDSFTPKITTDILPQETTVTNQFSQQTGSDIEFAKQVTTKLTPTEYEQQSNNNLDGIVFGQEQKTQSSQIVLGKQQRPDEFSEQNNGGIGLGQITQEKIFNFGQQNSEDFSPQVNSQNEFDFGQKTQEKLILVGNTEPKQEIFNQKQLTDNDFDQQENVEFEQKPQNHASVIAAQTEDQVSQQENVNDIQFQQNENNFNEIEFGQSTEGNQVSLNANSFQRKHEVEKEETTGHVSNDKDQYSNVFDEVNETDNLEQHLNKNEPGKENNSSTENPKKEISSIHDVPKYTEEEYKKIIQKFNTIFDFKNALNNIKLKFGQTGNNENSNFDPAQNSTKSATEEKKESQPTDIKYTDDSKENSNESKSNENNNVNNNDNKNKSEESNEIEDNKKPQGSSLWSSFREKVVDTYSSAKEKVKEVAGKVKESLN